MAHRHIKKWSNQNYNEEAPQTIRMAIINKSTNIKCWRGCGEKGTLLHCWWECKLVQPLWKTTWRFLRKLNIALLYDPAIPFLSIYLNKTIIQKGTGVPVMVQWKWIWLGTMRLQVWSLASFSGVGIRHCCELWCRSQMWLKSGVAVAVV